MDRQWICIKGRKLLCTEFISILDDYRYCSALTQCGVKICEQYNTMIYVLQEIANGYLDGQNYIGDQLEDFFGHHNMQMPSERKLPEALEELFAHLESKFNIDFAEMLDKCAARTNETYSNMQKLQVEEEKRILLVKSLKKENKIDKSIDEKIEDRIRNLLLLQKAKMESELYKLDEKEINITKVWCDLLISSVFSEVISYGLMLRLVENEVMTEAEITELLENKYDIVKDYEWYSEDFIGCGGEELTDIRIEDVLELCTGRVEKVIGTKI